MIQHSNAPWTIGIDDRTLRDERGHLIAILEGAPRDRRGNALVMHAAPDMVLALRGLVSAGNPGSAEHDAAVAKARAALKKAGL
jgi:hypothetical protein